MSSLSSPTSQRRAGVLLHPTSLPGTQECGDLGSNAYRFVDFLVSSGISVWQMLPIAPTHGDLSPYTALSVHAGNPSLIDLQGLVDKGWLESSECECVTGSQFSSCRHDCLSSASLAFQARGSDDDRRDYEQFRAQHAHWLDGYALFQAIRRHEHNQHWLAWPKPLRDRDPAALREAQALLFQDIEQTCFEQFVFFDQWHRLREYASERGVLLFGDVPIFVAHDSAEVWCHREYFLLDEEGSSITVAGVPPDYFSETGQRWGNPHYDWARMKSDDFKWWKERLATQLELFDWLRIDHFRGFEAYWEIAAHEDTAINGRWVKAPGDELFAALQKTFDPLPLVAEDLGIITDEVDALRKKYGMPGMKILQFAFGDDGSNPYLPHNHTVDSVVYTGTHDNDTTLGWYNDLDDGQKHRIREYLGYSNEEMPWALMRSALASCSRLAIIPLQDILGQDGEHRMNIPGTVEGNWRWRFEWDQFSDELASRMRQLVSLYGRVN